MNSKHTWTLMFATWSSILMYEMYDKFVKGVSVEPINIVAVSAFSCVMAMMFAWPEGLKANVLGLARIGWRFWFATLTYMGMQALLVSGQLQIRGNSPIHRMSVIGIGLLVILSTAVQAFFPEKKPARQTTDS